MSTAFVATAGLETAPLADGAVLYDVKTGKFIMLNRSADRLWSELSSAKTEDQLVRGLRQTYPEIDSTTARKAVSETLESLRGLDLVLARPVSEVDRQAPAVEGQGGGGDGRTGYAPPSVRVLDEEDLLKVFQMTAAEISVASCWWGNCPSAGCP